MRRALWITVGLLLAAGTWASTCGPRPAEASGTYRPPTPPKNRKFDQKTLEAGRQLFEGSALLGEGGQNCESCHGKKADRPLRRSRVGRKDGKLLERVNRCLTDPERGDGEKLVPGTESAYQLGAYLISRYRISFELIDGFREKPKPEK